jgi:hypothetical protein
MHRWGAPRPHSPAAVPLEVAPLEVAPRAVVATRAAVPLGAVATRAAARVVRRRLPAARRAAVPMRPAVGDIPGIGIAGGIQAAGQAMLQAGTHTHIRGRRPAGPGVAAVLAVPSARLPLLHHFG